MSRVARPSDEATDRLADEPIDGSSEELADRAFDEPFETFADKLADTLAEESDTKLPTKPLARSVEKSADEGTDQDAGADGGTEGDTDEDVDEWGTVIPCSQPELTSKQDEFNYYFDLVVERMQKDPLYLYTCSHPVFSQVVGLSRSSFPKDTKTICQHLRDCKIKPAQVLMKGKAGKYAFQKGRQKLRSNFPRRASPLRESWPFTTSTQEQNPIPGSQKTLYAVPVHPPLLPASTTRPSFFSEKLDNLPGLRARFESTAFSVLAFPKEPKSEPVSHGDAVAELKIVGSDEREALDATSWDTDLQSLEINSRNMAMEDSEPATWNNAVKGLEKPVEDVVMEDLMTDELAVDMAYPKDPAEDVAMEDLVMISSYTGIESLNSTDQDMVIDGPVATNQSTTMDIAIVNYQPGVAIPGGAAMEGLELAFMEKLDAAFRDTTIENVERITQGIATKISDMDLQDSELSSQDSDMDLGDSDMGSPDSAMDSCDSDVDSQDSDMDSQTSDMDSHDSDKSSQISAMGSYDSYDSDVDSQSSDMYSEESDTASRNSNMDSYDSDMGSYDPCDSDMDSQSSSMGSQDSDMDYQKLDLDSQASEMGFPDSESGFDALQQEPKLADTEELGMATQNMAVKNSEAIEDVIMRDPEALVRRSSMDALGQLIEDETVAGPILAVSTPQDTTNNEVFKDVAVLDSRRTSISPHHEARKICTAGKNIIVTGLTSDTITLPQGSVEGDRAGADEIIIPKLTAAGSFEAVMANATTTTEAGTTTPLTTSAPPHLAAKETSINGINNAQDGQNPHLEARSEYSGEPHSEHDPPLLEAIRPFLHPEVIAFVNAEIDTLLARERDCTNQAATTTVSKGDGPTSPSTLETCTTEDARGQYTNSPDAVSADSSRHPVRKPIIGSKVAAPDDQATTQESTTISVFEIGRAKGSQSSHESALQADIQFPSHPKPFPTFSQSVGGSTSASENAGRLLLKSAAPALESSPPPQKRKREEREMGNPAEARAKKRRTSRELLPRPYFPLPMALKTRKHKSFGGTGLRARKRQRQEGNAVPDEPHLSNTTISSLSFSQSDGAFDSLPYRMRPRRPSEPPSDLSWPNNIDIPHRHPGSSELEHTPHHCALSSGMPSIGDTKETDSEDDRYEDGEVRRYGAGESYRPFNRARSPRPTRSPQRERGRTPTGASDSYVPNRSPRRRSRSADRFRYRERSGGRDGDAWRRRDRSRSRARSPVRRASPTPRRSSPRRSPRRYSSPKRDDRIDRARSPPRRDADPRDSR